MLDGTQKRTYERTHPWITFELDTRRFDYQLWMNLGEAASKCEHIAGVPLAPEVAQDMLQIYLAKGVAATTAIEGNTLSEEEAREIIAGKLQLPPSQTYLQQEIENIVDAFNEMTDKISNDGVQNVTVEFLKRLNFLVLKDLEVLEDVKPGEIREHSVTVGRYLCAPAQDCEYLLERMCEILNAFEIPEESKISFSLLKAIFAHLYLVWIHPFGDGNGRTARLLELYILLCSGVAQPAGHLLSNHYNKTRNEYYTFLDQARASHDGPAAFVKYSIRGFVDGLREQIRFIRSQQWQVSWENYVHQQFHDRNTSADVRRRHLVLALSEKSTPTPSGKIRSLTPGLATEYYGKTAKTVARDINVLMDMKLILRVKGGIKANKSLILAFLPWRANT